MKKIALIFALFGFNFYQAAHAQTFLDLAALNPYTQYQHFETEHFEFNFQEGYLHFAQEAAKHLEHAHTILSPVLKWEPRSKIHVLIADNSDNANGFAMPALRVGMVLIATPPDQWLSTSYSENWIKLLVFHEYTHILNIDPTTQWMEWVRILFGDVIRPNGLWPIWMLEGLAVYFETRTSILGRGRSPYYDAVLRAYFNDGKLGNTTENGLTYDRINGDWPYFPGGETAYILGYQLWNQFGKLTQNDSKMGEYSYHSSHRIPFFIDGNLENVTGKQWGDFFNSFLTENNARYTNEIKAIKAQGETPSAKITDSKYGAIGGTISPNGEWLAYTETRLDERQGLVLQNLKTKKTFKVKDKLQGATLSFTPDSKKLLFSSVGRSGTYLEFSDLWIYDLENKKTSVLTDKLRAKDPHLSPDGKKVVFTRTDHATHLLVVADFVDSSSPKITNAKVIYRPSEFSMLGSPHWISNSEIVFSQQELNQTESVILKATLGSSEKTPTVLVKNSKINRFPFLCGNQIYYVSDFNGINNVFSLSEDPVTHGKQITNVVTDTQFPFCSPEGKLHGSLLTSNGFEIVKFSPPDHALKSVEKTSVPSAPETIKEATQSPPLTIDEKSIVPYSSFRTLLPRQWAPIGAFSYDGVTGLSLGGSVIGFDDTGKHQYIGSFGYNFKSETIDGSVSYTHYSFRPSITLTGQTYTSDIASAGGTQYKRTHEARLSLDYPIQWTWSSLRISPAAFLASNTAYNLNTHQRVMTGDPEYSHPLIPGGQLGITFSDAIQSKLGFMPEGGQQLTGATQARIYPEDFTLWKYIFEYSKFISVGEHKVLNPKLRYFGSSHPYGYDRSYALLKGKDTNDFFDRGTDFSLNRLQIRGYPDVTVKTRSSIQGTLDYHFPIDTFFGLTGPFYMKQLHGFVFADMTYIPSSRFKNLFLPAFGTGITADMTFLWHSPLKISFEMQYGTRKDFFGDQLFFFSLESELL